MKGSKRRGTRFVAAGAGVALAAAAVYAAAGNLDPTYGTSGVTVSLGQAGPANDVAVQSDGRALVGGNRATGQTTSTGSVQKWRIERFDAAGLPDTTWGAGGAVSLFGSESAESLDDLAIDGSGRCVAAGTSNLTQRRGFARTATVVRLTTSGSPDTTFGSGGVVRISVPDAGASFAHGVTVQADGKIVVAGRAEVASKGKTSVYPFVARLTATGALDSSFGAGGVAVDKRMEATAERVAVQGSGHVVVGGRGIDGTTTWRVTRFLPNGSVDSSFPAITSSSNFLHGLGVDRFDRIVATGNRKDSGSMGALVARYTASGAADASFGTSGATVIADFESSTFRTDPVFRSDDRIVVGLVADVTAGAGGENGDGTTAVRLLGDGQRDGAFGSNGVGDTISLATSAGGTWAGGIGLTSSGAAIVAGSTYGNAVGGRWFAARFLGD